MGDDKKEEEEKTVPVFTVFKKNSILKNIFLDAPQTTNQEDDEQVIVIGRHPDCSITLDHPSISRFHLRLHSKPSSRTLSLVDLSSVHGTWVSGKKVERGVQVDLNEGDIVQLGGSSRLYMLHWVPVSRAYNLDVPFVPPMDVLMTVRETEELSNQDENCCSSIETDQIQSQCTSVGNLDLSISKKEITVSPLSRTMPVFGDSSCDNEEAKKGNLYSEKRKQNEISGISSGQPLKEELIEEINNQHSDKDGENSPNASSPSNDHNKDLFRKEHEENEISGFSFGTPLKESAVTKFENQQADEENDENPQALAGLLTDKDNENSPNASSPSNDRNKDWPGKEHGDNEIVVTKFENQQSDEETDANTQALAGILTGISYTKSPSDDHNKNLLSEACEENEMSAFLSGQLLNELILEIVNRQYDDEQENSQSLDAAISDIANVNIPTVDHNEHPLKEEHQISAFSSGQLLNESVVEIEYQQYDEGYENSPDLNGVLSGIADVIANSTPTIDHYEHPLRRQFEDSPGQLLNESVIEIKYLQYDGEYEKLQPSNGVPSGIANVNSSPSYEHRLWREEFEEHEISAFSSGQLLNESVLEIKCQQYDEVFENSQALDGVLSGIADANSSSTIYHKEHPLNEKFEKNEISAFTSVQILDESVVEIGSQKYDEVFENSQVLDGVLSGIADANSSSTIYHKEHPLNEKFEKNEISAFTSVQILDESVVEIGSQKYDEVFENSQVLDGVLSGIADANSSSTIYHKEHPLNEKFEKNEISAFTSVQILDESVVEIGSQKYDEVFENSQVLDGVLSGIADANSSSTIYHNEHPLNEEFEKNEISAFTSVQIPDESVVEIGSQKYDEDNEKSQAVDGVPSSVANAHSLCQNYHNKNLPELFNSSFSDEDVEIIGASRMENEQEKIATSSYYSPCSSTILERKDQLYLYEQDNNVQYSLSSGVHAIQPLKNTPSKSEQEINWPEIMRHSLSDVCADVGESFEALDNKLKEITVITGAPKMDLMNLSICCESIPTEDCFEQLDEKNNTGQTFATNVSEPKHTDVNTLSRSGKQSDPPRSIRGKPTSIDFQAGEGFPTDTEVKELYKENVDFESVSEALITSLEVFAEEIFTPDKENFTPNTLKQRSTRKTDKLEEIKLSDSLCLSSICWNFVQNEELLFSSDKENHTPKVLQKSILVQPASKNSARLNLEPAKKNGTSRIPFKSLLSNSSSMSCSSNFGKYAQLIEKNAVAGDNKRWIMVADTNSLLNKVSRKALQLLQGVKGTQLIIPRVVIRELDCMKRRGYLFTRTTEISSALQWIEDCMINTNWWIHVESLMEEGRHLTPAPSLSSSKGEFEDFAISSAPVSAFPNILEIVSLTPGDHILECALLIRRMKNDENLVILSDDVSLKIKSMAEGIICEAAEEFRESLVNPFSDRFLWAKSSPRGLTWSCVDDIVLREKYYRGPLKKPPSKSGESLKGLKLILVQNSHFSGLIPNSTEMNCF